MITTGQSGNVLSPHYDDLITRHRDVAYLPMRFGRECDGDTLRLEAQIRWSAGRAQAFSLGQIFPKSVQCRLVSLISL